MSSAMGLMYEAITELMDACVRELRKTNKLDTSDLTVEQVLVYYMGGGWGGWMGGDSEGKQGPGRAPGCLADGLSGILWLQAGA